MSFTQRLCRSLCKLFSSFIILANIICYVVILLSKIETIESNLTDQPPLFFSDVNMYTCSLNLLLSVFTLFTISSNSKIWVKICQKILGLDLGFTIGAIFYLFWFYLPSAGDYVSRTIASSSSNFQSVLNSVGIVPVGGKIVLSYQKFISFYINAFCLIQIGTLVMTFFNIKLLKNVTITVKEEKKEVPKVEVKTAGNIQRMGFKMTRPISVGVAA